MEHRRPVNGIGATLTDRALVVRSRSTEGAWSSYPHPVLVLHFQPRTGITAVRGTISLRAGRSPRKHTRHRPDRRRSPGVVPGGGLRASSPRRRAVYVDVDPQCDRRSATNGPMGKGIARDLGLAVSLCDGAVLSTSSSRNEERPDDFVTFSARIRYQRAVHTSCTIRGARSRPILSARTSSYRCVPLAGLAACVPTTRASRACSDCSCRACVLLGGLGPFDETAHPAPGCPNTRRRLRLTPNPTTGS